MIGVLGLCLLVIGVVGYLFWGWNQDYLWRYISFLGTVIAFPLKLLVKAMAYCVFILLALMYIIASLGKTFVKASLKSAMFIALIIPIIIAFLVSTLLPFLGAGTQTLNQRISQYLPSSNLAEEAQAARKIMIEIIVEIDDRNPRFEKEDTYRDEIDTLQTTGEERLRIGESILSICIGGLLLISQSYRLALFDLEIFGHPIGLPIQASLYLLALSAIYRIAILDILSITPEEDFSSLEEFDVALSYQEGISKAGSIKFFAFVLALGMYISDVNRGLMRGVLKVRYDDEAARFDWVEEAWNRLNTENQEE